MKPVRALFYGGMSLLLLLGAAGVGVQAQCPTAGPSFAFPSGLPFPSTVRPAGDFNGDGRHDVLASENSSREIYVFDVTTGTVLAGPLGIATPTTTPFPDRPWRAHGVGDLDGDGYDDIALGDEEADPLGPGSANAGSVFVYRGGPVGGAQTGTLLYQWDGAQAEARLGWSVAGIGDVNGDGVPDVLAGAPNTARRIYVFSGADGAILFQATDPNVLFGQRVTGIGDYNGDGVRDFAVGWDSFVFPGVRIYSGDATATPSGLALGTPIEFLAGFGPSRFGTRIAPIGDVNGDNKDELLVADAHNVYVITHGGLVVSSFAAINVGLPGGFSGAQFEIDGCVWDLDGTALGDVTGDDLPDFLVGLNPGCGCVGAWAAQGVGGNFCMLTQFAGGLVAGIGDTTFDGRPEVVVQQTAYFAPGFNVPTYPGSGDPLLLRSMTSFLGASGKTAMPDIKPASTGNLVGIEVFSGNPAAHGVPFVLALDLFPTGCPPAGILPAIGIHVSLGASFVVNGFGSPSGLGPVLPSQGTCLTFGIPPGLSGTSLLFQAAAIPSGPTPAWWFTDAHEIRIL